jgi:diguanylate cyclase
MPEARWEEAIVAAERLRRQVAVYGFAGNDLHCTISVGLSEVNSSIASVTDWINVADAALYEAKRRGRDCIEVARLPQQDLALKP